MTTQSSFTDLANPARDKTVRHMALACALGFGGFAAWGATAPLEEGVAASGQIVVEDNRQQVQHLEGGIVSEIHVREGQWVERGDVLVILQRTASLANRDQVVQEYGALAASVARLRALQDGRDAPDFSALDPLDLGALERADIESRERGLFREQQSALSAEVAVLRARIRSAEQIQNSRSARITIAERGLASARNELQTINSMFAQQLARRDQVTASERLVAELEGEIATLEGERDNARADVVDLSAQIAQARASSARDVATSLLEISAELLAAEERLGAAQDVLDRSIITAPVSGEVLNMSQSTVGGVVASGSTLMEIIPAISEVTASVQIAAIDRPTVFEGQTVRTQLSAYKGWQAPRLEGEVIDISADLKTDPVTSVSYYEARVRVPESEIARTNGVEITPGMPVDTFIYSGRSRTFFSYIMEPLSDSLFIGLRQS